MMMEYFLDMPEEFSKEENAKYYDNLLLSQKIDIDKNGMLLYKKEFAKDANSVNTGTLIQNASYIYN